MYRILSIFVGDMWTWVNMQSQVQSKFQLNLKVGIPCWETLFSVFSRQQISRLRLRPLKCAVSAQKAPDAAPFTGPQLSLCVAPELQRYKDTIRCAAHTN